MSNVTPTTSICIPGEDAWELWKQSPTGMHLAQSMRLENGGSPAAFKAVDCFGYPIISAFAVPVWAASSDPEIIDGVVSLQLEKMSLMPDNPVGQLLDTRIIERGENRTLATATVLDEKITPDLPQLPPGSFEVTPALFYLPDNSIILWKELGRLVFCLTRGEHPVYFHALTDSELSPAAVAEISSLLMPLYMQEIVPELDGIVLWTDAIVPGSDRELSNELHLPLKRQPKPAPVLPKTPSSFEPVAIALGKIRAAKLRRLRRIVSTCAAVYLAIIAAMVGWHLWNVSEAEEISKKVVSLRGQVGFVEPTVAQWEATEPLRDRDRFPIELVRRYLEPLAARQFGGVKATSVRVEGNSVEIKGECQAQNVGINFTNWLRTNADTKGNDWTGPTWGPARNGIFTFTINGKRKEAENDT